MIFNFMMSIQTDLNEGGVKTQSESIEYVIRKDASKNVNE